MFRASASRYASHVHFGQDPTIFKRLSAMQLLKTMLVFRVCGVKFLVRHSRAMLDMSERVLGSKLTYDVLVKNTVYSVFCAGETEKALKPSLAALQDQGIGPILDYAAEAPSDTSSKAKELTASVLEVDLRALLKRPDIVYSDDEPLDANVGRFIQCMDSARSNMPPSGIAFAAVKVSGLYDPQLLARMSALLLRIRQTWGEFFIPENDGVAPLLEYCRDVCGHSADKAKRPRRCDVDDFKKGLRRMQPSVSDETMEKLIARLDPNGNGHVHFFDYTSMVGRYVTDPTYNPEELHPFKEHIVRFTEAEAKLAQASKARLEKVIKYASECKVRVMIDAEQTYYQMAIDAIVRDLQRTYNKTFPCVYNTYQGYLKYSQKRVGNDLARSRREGWIFAAKLVRGAYLNTERRDAERIGYESPVHETKEDTHRMYDQIGHRLLDEIASGNPVAVLFGTHNVTSLQLMTDRLVALESVVEDPASIDVAFAQLYGMGDHLTLPLAKAGHRAFKYVPYGPVKETVFYLQRRAEENQDMMGQSTGEWPLLKNELKRKLFKVA